MQGRLAVAAVEITSGPERGWTCRTLDCMFGRSLPDISEVSGIGGIVMGWRRSLGQREGGSGCNFLCTWAGAAPSEYGRAKDKKIIVRAMRILSGLSEL